MGKKSEESIAISDDSSNFADDLHKGLAQRAGNGTVIARKTDVFSL